MPTETLDAKDTQAHLFVAIALLLMETVLSSIIILKVPYTEIDWHAYMEQIQAYRDGERDYVNLRGGTGPLVYPAGFVHLFNGLKLLTNGDVFKAQITFLVVYLFTEAFVMRLMARSACMPPWSHVLLTMSKRIHSIYLLRLFNDCWAMLAAYIALDLLCSQLWTAAIMAFSLAVSIKMNALLFAPGVLAVCLRAAPLRSMAAGVAGGALIQALLALPFLLHAPRSYLTRAFDFSRVFQYQWTVNWRMLPEGVFLDKRLALALLALQILLLLAFAERKWLRPRGGLLVAVRRCACRRKTQRLAPADILTIVLTSNFIGIVTARSLHYQFYAWYFHSLPFLFWTSKQPGPILLVSLLVIELCWNVYPSTPASAGCLLLHHAGLLWALWDTRVRPSVKGV